jgi:hypothetical protein
MMRGVIPQGRQSLFRLILLMGMFMAGPCHGDEECPRKEGVILSGEVNVTATCECQDIGDPGQAYTIYDCKISVEKNAKTFRSGVYFRTEGRAEDPHAHIRELTVWKDGFLFVRYEGGGGNAWRHDFDYVFTVRDGELICLGSVLLYEHSQFYDVYDGLELNALTSHAAAPHFEVVMTEQNGALVANLDTTWALNKTDHDRCVAEIDKYLQSGEREPERDHEVTSCLLGNAILARYCDRQTELEKVLSQTKRILSAKDFDTFHGSVYSVVPGETHKRCEPLREKPKRN